MPQALTVRKLFSRETTISADIAADPATVWQLITNARAFPTWNTTVISLDGEIALGKRISLTSTLDPSRVFKLTVKEFVPNKRLVWGDAMGKRTYTLTKKGNGSTGFCMNEKIGGPLFPLFAKMIPPFDASFERFTSDLKRAAEGSPQGVSE